MQTEQMFEDAADKGFQTAIALSAYAARKLAAEINVPASPADVLRCFAELIEQTDRRNAAEKFGLKV